jgi:hypothetical protein
MREPVRCLVICWGKMNYTPLIEGDAEAGSVTEAVPRRRTVALTSSPSARGHHHAQSSLVLLAILFGLVLSLAAGLVYLSVRVYKDEEKLSALTPAPCPNIEDTCVFCRIARGEFPPGTDTK